MRGVLPRRPSPVRASNMRQCACLAGSLPKGFLLSYRIACNTAPVSRRYVRWDDCSIVYTCRSGLNVQLPFCFPAQGAVAKQVSKKGGGSHSRRSEVLLLTSTVQCRHGHFCSRCKQRPIQLTDRVGFEPTVRYERTHTFQACALNHSATCPDTTSQHQQAKKARATSGPSAK